MVRRALLIALLGCIAYSLLVALLPRSLIRRGVSDQQLNYVRAEQVLFASEPPDNVLIGSSIAGVLRQEQMGDSLGLMAFGGGCSETGVRLLSGTGRVPKRLFVEANVVVKNVDAEMIRYFTAFPLAQLRRGLPILRQSNQPGNLLMSVFQQMRAPPDRVQSASLLNAGLDHYRKINQNPLNPEVVRKDLQGLRNILVSFKNQGCQVVFVGFPIHPELVNSPREAAFRKEVLEAFPESEFTWLRPSAGVEWKTTDGVHMTSDSARRFAALLRDYANK